MKRAAFTTVILLVPLFLVLAGVADAGIEGSKHDFSNDAWSGGDTCGACHTPHREAPKSPPLWDTQADLNRVFGTTDPRRERTEVGDLTRENRAQGTRVLAGEWQQPGAATLTCLRCHDGALARDFVPSPLPRNLDNAFHPGFFAAGHGRSDHPVGVPYPGVNRGYQPLSKVLSIGTIRLPGGFVECTSCHDPHNEAGVPHMLVMNNAGSALCLSCHRK